MFVFVASVMLLNISAAYSEIMPVHEYNRTVEAPKITNCTAQEFPLHSCGEGMNCESCYDNTLHRFKFVDCKDNYTFSSDKCIKNCSDEYVLNSNELVPNGLHACCEDAQGKRCKFLGSCAKDYGYNGNKCIVNCPVEYNLNESQLDSDAANYVSCEDYKDNNHRVVYKFVNCKETYENVNGTCVKQGQDNPDQPDDPVKPIERTCNRNIFESTDCGGDCYVCNKCTDNTGTYYDLDSKKCHSDCVDNGNGVCTKPVIDIPTEETCDRSIYTSKYCGDCYICRACKDKTGTYYDISSKNCKLNCSLDANGLCIKNCYGGSNSKPANAICTECVDARGTWYSDCHRCEYGYAKINGKCECDASGFTMNTCPPNATCEECNDKHRIVACDWTRGYSISTYPSIMCETKCLGVLYDKNECPSGNCAPCGSGTKLHDFGECSYINFPLASCPEKGYCVSCNDKGTTRYALHACKERYTKRTANATECYSIDDGSVSKGTPGKPNNSNSGGSGGDGKNPHTEMKSEEMDCGPNDVDCQSFRDNVVH